MDGRSDDAPRSGPETFAPLSVYVVATSIEGTWSALTKARRLTTGRDARVTLLVPRQPSLSAGDAATDWSRLADGHRALVTRLGLNATVHVCVCRRVDDVVHQMLDRSSLLIIGGRGGVVWPTREERLAHRLVDDGYPVVFAQVGTGRDATGTESPDPGGPLTASPGHAQAPLPALFEDAQAKSAGRTEIAGRPRSNDSTRPWLLTGIAFVVFVMLLAIWALVARPPLDRNGATPAAAVHQIY